MQNQNKDMMNFCRKLKQKQYRFEWINLKQSNGILLKQSEEIKNFQVFTRHFCQKQKDNQHLLYY